MPIFILLEFLCYIRYDTGDISYAIQAWKTHQCLVTRGTTKAVM